jgi:hypothetical protein
LCHRAQGLGLPAVQPKAQAQHRRLPRLQPGSLQTEISAPSGHVVVLGVTPTGSVTSVFAVQVLRKDAGKSPPRK